ncbi:MAG: FAD-binding oxidoreductase [Saprospiraceae bacterium]|jgi:glycine/D-amino acid oxidase-like deaminating enzyme|nr:FAD-binding oxidoreductase [Saprospiraceae bacterium]
MNYSFWEKKYIESKADITILGSGIVGLSTAISIKEKQPWLTVKILERGSLPYGASTKNAGFSCFGSVSELMDDIASMGEASCTEIVKMRWLGLSKLKSRVGEAALEYKHCGGIELFRHSDSILMNACFEKIDYCNKLIYNILNINDCYHVKKNQLLSGFADSTIYNQYEGTINPMSMMNNLIQKAILMGVDIINGINIIHIDQQNKILTGDCHIKIEYEKLIVCTNGFTSSLIPSLPVVPARNQVLITKVLPDNPLDSACHLDKGYVYFRNYEGRILLGGGRNIDHQAELTDQFGNTPVISDYLKTILETIYPGGSNKIDYWWSGILGVGPSKYPICEWVNPDILVGVRMGGMGIAIGSYMGDKLASELDKI